MQSIEDIKRTVDGLVESLEDVTNTAHYLNDLCRDLNNDKQVDATLALAEEIKRLKAIINHTVETLHRYANEDNWGVLDKAVCYLGPELAQQEIEFIVGLYVPKS